MSWFFGFVWDQHPLPTIVYEAETENEGFLNSLDIITDIEIWPGNESRGSAVARHLLPETLLRNAQWSGLGAEFFRS